MKQKKYGFVYIWRDRKQKRYYIGCHWGTVDDGYLCSSNWMRDVYKRRPEDFKRRIIKTGLTRKQMYDEELRYFKMIKKEELRTRYYNFHLAHKQPWHQYPAGVKTIGQKISAAKTGKKVNFKDPAERARKIAEGKRKAFAKRLAETGSKMADTSKMGRKPGYKHTEQWKAAAKARIQEQWDSGVRNKSELSERMMGNTHRAKVARGNE